MAILEWVIRSSAVLLIALALDRIFARYSRFRDVLWPSAFLAVAAVVLPLPMTRLPLFESVSSAPESGGHVYELDSRFSLDRIHYSTPGVPLLGVLLAVAVGVGLVAFALQVIRSWNLVRASQQVTDSEFVNMTYDVSDRVGLIHSPHVVLTDELRSPAIVGLFSPTLVIPCEFSSTDDPARRLIVIHEIGHIRRRDPLRIALFGFIRAVFWWNPLAWAAYRRGVLAMEERNDEQCLEVAGDRKLYARLLTSNVLPQRGFSAVGLFGHSDVLTRVRTIVDPRGRSRSLAPLASTLLFIPAALPFSLERFSPPRPGTIGLNEMVVASDRTLPSRLWRVRLDGSDWQALPDTFVSALTAGLSPDGTKLAYVKSGPTGQQDIYVANIDGTGARPLITFPGRNYEPAWSPDGKRIAFGTTTTGTWNIGVVDVETGQSRLVTNDTFGNLEPSWHPGGTRLTFSSLRTGYKKIWSVNLDGSHMVQLTPGDWQDVGGSYSHDGRTLGFASHRLGKYDVYLMDLASGECRLMTRDLDFDTTSTLFVQGDSKIASISVKEGLFQVVLISLSDGSHRFLTSGKATMWAAVR